MKTQRALTIEELRAGATARSEPRKKDPAPKEEELITVAPVVNEENTPPKKRRGRPPKEKIAQVQEEVKVEPVKTAKTRAAKKTPMPDRREAVLPIQEPHITYKAKYVKMIMEDIDDDALISGDITVKHIILSILGGQGVRID